MSVNPNDPMVDGFKTINYPSKRKSYRGKKFQWTKHPYGRFAKILVGLSGDHLANGTVVNLTRKFALRGCTAENLHRILVYFLPDFPKFYLEKTGNRLIPDMVRNRYHKMYYEHKKGIKGGKANRCKEHYENDPTLRPYVEAVRKLWLAGKPISYELACRTCSPASKALI